ncbi:SnoaL-like domain, partial [Dillenia turbinata]
VNFMFCNPMAASNLSSFSFSLRSRIKKSSLSYLSGEYDTCNKSVFSMYWEIMDETYNNDQTSQGRWKMKLEVVCKIAVHWHANQKVTYDHIVKGGYGLGCFTSAAVSKLKYFVQFLLFTATSAASVGQGSSFLANPCQVKSEDSEGTIGSDDIALDEQTLEQELQKAIEEENYALAATLRDRLKLRQMDSKASVLAANGHFYKSFRNGDLATMQALWAKGDHVCCVHPGVSGISGYDLVMGSWEFVWADYEFPLEIELKDVQVHVRGDLGYVTCVELVKTKGSSWGRQFATNVFERIDGEWYICIHHASYVDL